MLWPTALPCCVKVVEYYFICTMTWSLELINVSMFAVDSYYIMKFTLTSSLPWLPSRP